ncbi:phosphotransferase KptA/Tpt1 [Cokeromyces recurvatus]|uniref:phosphotransferase KptA/Tpt1 n=1 Tax=Cokeromyces recurvatus TaxID=90255 RepID=UPI00221E7852|nr:phosphotransferase KptA/Tpt1 [Cokeromyces recurvatus]KAI7900447.1 phosphotransferase KptA/Tpt1 [Cokeromyces recurvatus]
MSEIKPLLNPQEAIQLSKLLSYILRHGAVKEKLQISTDGYIAVNDLLGHSKFKKVTFEQIRYVVDTNDKKRYELSELPPTSNNWFIRASQGHSIKSIDSNELLEEITDKIDTCVIHGTNLQAWQHIKEKGLSKMNRNHIHFAVGLPGDPNVKSGIRKTSEIFIYIDTEKARQDGIIFYRSKNHVILSNGIEGIIAPKYFKKVIDKEGKQINL